MDVDNLIVRNHQILSFEPARLQDVSSLQNWINGTGFIARAETAYLSHSNDLLRVVSMDDTVMVWLETLIEKVLFRFHRWFGKVSHLHSEQH